MVRLALIVPGLKPNTHSLFQAIAVVLQNVLSHFSHEILLKMGIFLLLIWYFYPSKFVDFVSELEMEALDQYLTF